MKYLIILNNSASASSHLHKLGYLLHREILSSIPYQANPLSVEYYFNEFANSSIAKPGKNDDGGNPVLFPVKAREKKS